MDPTRDIRFNETLDPTRNITFSEIMELTRDIPFNEIMELTSNITFNETRNQQDKAHSPLLTAQNIFLLIIAPIILLGNLLILLTIRKTRSLHRVTFYFLGNLAAADFLYGIALGIRNALALQGGLFGYRCSVMRSLVILSAQSSLSGTLLLSIQNYLCVRYPVRFQSGLPTRFSGILVCVMWILWGGLAICGVAFNDHEPLETECHLLSKNRNRTLTVILVSLAVLQVLALITLQISTLNRIHERRRFHQSNTRDTLNPSALAQSNAGLRRLNRMSKVVNIVRIILVLSFVFWAPLIIGMLLFFLCPESCGVDQNMLHILGSISTFNSLVNIFIYYTKSKEFHSALMDMICCCTNRVGIVATF